MLVAIVIGTLAEL